MYPLNVNQIIPVAYPEVTYLLPISKDLNFLGSCLASFDSENYPNFEIMVIVNGSLLSLEEVMGVVRIYDQSIKIQALYIDGGLAEALNFGILRSRSKYIARIDADDLIVTGRTRSQVSYLEKNSSIGVVGGQATLIDSKGTQIGALNYLVGRYLVTRRMNSRCAVGHPFVMFRRELVISVGCYKTTTFPAEDYDLWKRLLKITKFSNLPIVVGKHRIHDNQVSRLFVEEQIKLTRKIAGNSKLNFKDSNQVTRKIKRFVLRVVVVIAAGIYKTSYQSR